MINVNIERLLIDIFLSLLHIFRTSFPKNTYGGLPLKYKYIKNFQG